MSSYARVDKIVNALAGLGVVKTQKEVNRHFLRSLTNDHQLEAGAVLHRAADNSCPREIPAATDTQMQNMLS